MNSMVCGSSSYDSTAHGDKPSYTRSKGDGCTKASTSRNTKGCRQWKNLCRNIPNTNLNNILRTTGIRKSGPIRNSRATKGQLPEHTEPSSKRYKPERRSPNRYIRRHRHLRQEDFAIRLRRCGPARRQDIARLPERSFRRISAERCRSRSNVCALW